MGKLETDTTEINRRVRAVRSIAQQSIATLLAGYHQKGCVIGRAGLVVGSQVDPDSIGNAHIRAHAFEGQLFRFGARGDLAGKPHSHRDSHRAGCVRPRRYETQRSNENVRRVIRILAELRRGPWRAEQKTRRACCVARALLATAIVEAWSSAFSGVRALVRAA